MSFADSIAGCIFGTALGDATGLKREGMSRDWAVWLHGERPSPDLLFGRGLCSDDTEHTVIAACSLIAAGGTPDVFENRLAANLRKWLLTCPPGIGLGTLRAIVKSFFVGPARSGVYSAGNGPAMRSALLGVCASDDEHLAELATRSTRITHSDPRANEGALVVAKAARFASQGKTSSVIEFVREQIEEIDGEELKQNFIAVERGLNRSINPRQFAEEQGWQKGVSGYVNQTVPAAIYCWANSPTDFRLAVTSAVLLGGDTDSVAAITGAITGAGVGFSDLPKDWLEQLSEWPRNKTWMSALSTQLAIAHQSWPKTAKSPSLKWAQTIVRNLFFGAVVIFLFARRFMPIRSGK